MFNGISDAELQTGIYSLKSHIKYYTISGQNEPSRGHWTPLANSETVPGNPGR